MSGSRVVGAEQGCQRRRADAGAAMVVASIAFDDEASAKVVDPFIFVDSIRLVNSKCKI